MTGAELVAALEKAPDYEKSAVLADASAELGSLEAVYELLDAELDKARLAAPVVDLAQVRTLRRAGGVYRPAPTT